MVKQFSRAHALPSSGMDKLRTLVQYECPRTNTNSGSKKAVGTGGEMSSLAAVVRATQENGKMKTRTLAEMVRNLAKILLALLCLTGPRPQTGPGLKSPELLSPR